MKETTNYKLKKIELTDSPPDITVINPNWDTIDEKLYGAVESKISYATASGTNTYTVSVPGISSLTEGLSIKVKFTNANTGAATLNVNSLGTKSIVKSNGNALINGNIKAGQICHLVYTGSNFQLLGEGGEYGTAQVGDVLSGKTIGTESGLITGTMPNRGAISNTITTQNGQIAVPQGYHNGSGTVKAQFSNLTSPNIRDGVNIGGIVGNFGKIVSSDSIRTTAKDETCGNFPSNSDPGIRTLVKFRTPFSGTIKVIFNASAYYYFEGGGVPGLVFTYYVDICVNGLYKNYEILNFNAQDNGNFTDGSDFIVVPCNIEDVIEFKTSTIPWNDDDDIEEYHPMCHLSTVNIAYELDASSLENPEFFTIE